MINNFQIGRYLEGDTFLHKINPIIKLVMMLMFGATLLLKHSMTSSLIGFTFVTILGFSAGFNLRNYQKIIKFSLLFLYFSFFSSFIRFSADYYFTFLFFIFSNQNIIIFIINATSILSIIFFSSVITMTTTTIEFIKSFEPFFTIQNRFTKSIKEFLFILVLAIGFIPLILEEANKIIIAQKSRNIINTEVKSLKKLKNYINLVPPLFISTFRRAETISLSIDCKCYGMPLEKKTMPRFELTRYDFIFSLIFIIMILLLQNI